MRIQSFSLRCISARRFLLCRGSTNLVFTIAMKHSGSIRHLSTRLYCATINSMYGTYAEALKELNYVISLHPQRVTLARALKQRAWLQANCPNPAFRNGQQAIKDAKAACSIAEWRDENTIDTLAAAYAETGDFDWAVRYAAQALAVKGITPVDQKHIRRHLTLFQQHQPVRL